MSNQEKRSDEGDVRCTKEMLTLIVTIKAAAALYRSEETLAEDFGKPAPESWQARSRELFYRTYAAEADRVGLARNEKTWETLNYAEIPPEAMSTQFDCLGQWVFNPWFGWRRDEAYQAAASAWTHDSIKALAFKHGLTPRTIVGVAGGGRTVNLDRDDKDDCFYQVVLTSTSHGQVRCNVGLYGSGGVVVNDGDLSWNNLDRAVEDAVARISRIAATR